MQISKATGGTFYRAQDASQLSSALAKLPAAFTIVHKHVDIAAGVRRPRRPAHRRRGGALPVVEPGQAAQPPVAEVTRS